MRLHLLLTKVEPQAMPVPSKCAYLKSNKACERAIGWWIKERYRSMRGYKVPANALRMSRRLSWCGNFLTRGGADLALLLG